MRVRRPERAAVALMLTALVASVLLLGRPASGAESATPADNSATSQGTTVELGSSIKATIRYGCSDGGWVEATIKSKDDDAASDTEQVFQVGLAGTGTDGAEIFYAEGGPSQVVATEHPVTVRLAGPAHEADHVFIKRVGSSEVTNIPLSEDCRNRRQTDFGLDVPSLAVGNASCAAGAKATLPVALDNPNELDSSTLRLGLTELDYTVLLVRSNDGQLMAPTNGHLVRFDGPGKGKVALSAPASKRTTYEVRVIGVDGSVVQSNDLSVSCVLGRPPTPTPTPPTKTPSSTPSSTLSSSASVPPTTTPTTLSSSASVPPTNAPTPSASLSNSRSQSSAASPSAHVGSSTSSSRVATPTTGRTQPSVTASSVVVVPSEPSSSTPASPTPSKTPKFVIAEPSANSNRIFVWQRDAALVVLLDAAAISMLVGATVWQAKRR